MGEGPLGAHISAGREVLSLRHAAANVAAGLLTIHPNPGPNSVGTRRGRRGKREENKERRIK